MASAIGSAVTGFMQGQKHMDDRRRNKAIDNLLDRDAYEKDLDYEARKRESGATADLYGKEAPEYPEFSNPAMDDPWLVKGFNWLKQKFGSGGGEDSIALVEDDTPTPERSALPEVGSYGMQGRGGVPMYADGGKVQDDERMKRSYGDYYVTEEEAAANRAHRAALPPRYQSPTSPYMRDQRGRLEAGRKPVPTYTGSGPGLDVDDVKEVGRSIKDSAAGVFDDTIRTANTAREATDETGRAVKEAEGARETGTALRKHAYETARAGLGTAAAVGKDVLVDNPVTQGILGFIGFDGKRDSRQPDPQTPPPQVVAGEPEPKAAAIDATGQDAKTDAAVAEDAVQAGVEMTPGHPDNPDQAFDWEEVAQSGVRPEDIPNMTSGDWEEYRYQMAQAATMRGGDPIKVQQDITKMQMQGAQSNLQQAAFLLKAGNPRGAALAARAAFQYFPNGSDVRFGIYDGADGPVLVGMGVDEETGEPVGEGKPMMLTPDAIAAMAANFSDPSAFMTWTKDWHAMAQEDRKYNEIDKPKAQADINLAGAKEDAYRADAEATRMEALNPSGGRKAPTEADLRASNETLRELAYEYGIDEDNLQTAMADATWVRQVMPSQYDLSDDQIMKMLAEGYETGDFSQLEKYLPQQNRQALPSGE